MSFLMLLQTPLKFWQMCKNSPAKISRTPQFFIRCVNNAERRCNHLWALTWRLTGHQDRCGTVLHCTVPVVHEDVRGPDVGGGDAQVLDVPVLGLVPPQIVVSPLLWCEHKYFYVSQLFSRPFTQIFFCPNIVFAFAFWITNKTIFKALSLCLYCHHLSTAARKYSNIHNHDILLLVDKILIISLFWTLKKYELKRENYFRKYKQLSSVDPSEQRTGFAIILRKL